jgi:hypothetical protein
LNIVTASIFDVVTLPSTTAGRSTKASALRHRTSQPGVWRLSSGSKAGAHLPTHDVLSGEAVTSVQNPGMPTAT